MNLPGFTAESSLHCANSSHAGSYHGPIQEGVIPQYVAPPPGVPQYFLVPTGYCGPCLGGVQACDYLLEICYGHFTLIEGEVFNCYRLGSETVDQPCPSGPLHVVTSPLQG